MERGKFSESEVINRIRKDKFQSIKLVINDGNIITIDRDVTEIV